jgi:hypothetical protein
MSVDLTDEMLQSILVAVTDMDSNEPMIDWIAPYTSCRDSDLVEGVLFLKPEGTNIQQGVDVRKILDYTANQITKFGLSVASAAVINAKYLDHYNIIAEHYGVINKISKNGADAISAQASQKLKDILALDANQPEVLGGHQVLSSFEEITPKALDVLIGNLGFKKLAPGTYCTKVLIDGREILLLNGFHPYQLQHFTKPGGTIVAFLLRGRANWKSLREDFLGATTPADAKEGSLRRIFHDQRGPLCLKQVNQANNVIHFSAGPLEGMFETIRYFSDCITSSSVSLASTCFGSLLMSKGVALDEIDKLKANPALPVDGKYIPAFDLTEETQPSDSADLISSHLAVGRDAAVR